MNRYDSVKRVKNEDDITRLQLTYNIPIKEDDEFIYIHNIDRNTLSLFILAKQYYGDSKLWWIIAKANKLKLPYNIRDEHIRIPKNITNITTNIS